MPSPLDTSLVAIILAYVHSQQRIPPTLLSNDLLKRHHFLAVSPDNPHEYLCWQTDNPTHPRALDRLLTQKLDEFQHSDYSVQYTADPEHEYAHCYLRSTGDSSDPGLRFVFQWDISDNLWKYHDLALMPFPPGSHPDLLMAQPDQVFHSNDVVDFLHEPAMPQGDGGSEDAYWNAYGQDDDPDDGLPQSKTDAPLDPEEAYWAQYATVHGSGDSTQPSPLPAKRNKSSHLPNDPANPQNQPQSRAEPLVVSDSPVHPATNPYSDFPSPLALASKLSAISRTSASPHEIKSPDSLRENADCSTDSSASSPPPSLLKLGVKAAGSSLPGELLVKTSPPSLGSAIQQKTKSLEPPQADDEDTDALKESICGIYRLWKAGRRMISPSPYDGAATSEDEKVFFLSLVSEAIQRY